MIEQYPDSIVITVSASASQNASGIWVSGATSAFTFDCRAEVNSAGRKIPGNDGSLIDYNFNVYLPKMTTIIPVDSDYVLDSLISGIVAGKVKGASNGQLNSRLWL
jgi:hypothetical protein